MLDPEVLAWAAREHRILLFAWRDRPSLLAALPVDDAGAAFRVDIPVLRCPAKGEPTTRRSGQIVDIDVERGGDFL
jgi:hypothetical protein